MIAVGAGARVMVATSPVDFRKGMDGLAALVQAEMRSDPFSGVIYVFRAKRADRIKLIWWDGTGLCLMAKKLEQGSLQVADHPGRCHAFDGGTARGIIGGSGLAPGPWRTATTATADCLLTSA